MVLQGKSEKAQSIRENIPRFQLLSEKKEKKDTVRGRKVALHKLGFGKADSIKR